ncbi:hypothetical protein AAFP30_16550 [Gordonia sp. CPCC 205515]|uniref:hypothetical protein n=1 Tax=Gordonia sp. CPCC 205515 TaxID=3140791 RepID=UPI003AF33FDD
MSYRAELERLATLDADTIDRVCAAPPLAADLIEGAVDDCIDFDERADEYLLSGDAGAAAFCRQEAAAWRATVVVLRAIAAAPSDVVVRVEGVA